MGWEPWIVNGVNPDVRIGWTAAFGNTAPATGLAVPTNTTLQHHVLYFESAPIGTPSRREIVKATRSGAYLVSR